MIICQLNKNNQKELKANLQLFGYKQLIKQPTKVTTESSTPIDIILCNNESEVSFTDVIPLNLSDHDEIACSMKINHIKYEY